MFSLAKKEQLSSLSLDAASPGSVHGFGSLPVSTYTGTPQVLPVSSPLAPQGISELQCNPGLEANKHQLWL